MKRINRLLRRASRLAGIRYGGGRWGPSRLRRYKKISRRLRPAILSWHTLSERKEFNQTTDKMRRLEAKLGLI